MIVDGTRQSDRAIELVLAYYAAFNRGDAAALAALYDEHAAVLPAGGEAALGTGQIEKRFVDRQRLDQRGVLQEYQE